MYAANVIF